MQSDKDRNKVHRLATEAGFKIWTDNLGYVKITTPCELQDNLNVEVERLINLAKAQGASEERAKNGRNKFFVDGLAYYTGQTALLGLEIKRIAGTSSYHMYYDNPDGTFLGDSEAIRLDGEVRHFFVVPPATF